jgi:hypothetical protein
MLESRYCYTKTFSLRCGGNEHGSRNGLSCPWSGTGVFAPGLSCTSLHIRDPIDTTVFVLFRDPRPSCSPVGCIGYHLIGVLCCVPSAFSTNSLIPLVSETHALALVAPPFVIVIIHIFFSFWFAGMGTYRTGGVGDKCRWYSGVVGIGVGNLWNGDE